jgi:hypothetical protein
VMRMDVATPSLLGSRPPHRCPGIRKPLHEVPRTGRILGTGAATRLSRPKNGTESVEAEAKPERGVGAFVRRC